MNRSNRIRARMRADRAGFAASSENGAKRARPSGREEAADGLEANVYRVKPRMYERVNHRRGDRRGKTSGPLAWRSGDEAGGHNFKPLDLLDDDDDDDDDGDDGGSEEAAHRPSRARPTFRDSAVPFT